MSSYTNEKKYSRFEFDSHYTTFPKNVDTGDYTSNINNNSIKHGQYGEIVKEPRRTIPEMLKDAPVFAELYQMGFFKRSVGILVNDSKWETTFKVVCKVLSNIIPITFVNTSEEGLFFRTMPQDQTTIIIYGLFDEDLAYLLKANFVKKAMMLLASGGYLVLLADKTSPDQLNDIVEFSGSSLISNTLQLDDTEVVGVIVKKP